jgi:hypothetical protein
MGLPPLCAISAANRPVRSDFRTTTACGSDRAVDGLIVRCILDGRLSESQALKPRLVAQALAQLLEEEGQRCAR